ncbi:helix-turn-helix domain-containing protein [Demetria terragena]|uniref:helix-turn-helix domain-containing protein n=1 Tax=Demetria terragena TaxID=63959 RepID=UPI00036ADA30|nr:helix-turn-helix domain-containing protein [Demetria terragena]
MSGTFGPLLRQARRKSGLTQEDLAAASGLSVEGISLLERGVRTRPRGSTVALIVEALDLPAEDASALRIAAVEGDTSTEPEVPIDLKPSQTPSATSRPARELPPLPAHLVGRDADLKRLEALAQGSGPVIALVGLGGVGKSALAISLAHQISHHFPDGVIYLDLRGTDRSERLGPLPALRSMMASIGADPYSLPLDIERASASWRSATAGQRFLLVLDDAADLHQVQPLLPSPGGTVLLTSRRGLAAGHLDMQQHEVTPLSQEDARSLLLELASARSASEARPGEDEESDLHALADRCHGLPLALRMIGARLTSRSHWPARYLLERIDSAGGNLLDFTIGDLSLRQTLVTSVEELDASSDPTDILAYQVFLALGLIPGGPVSLTVIGCLVGLDDLAVDPVVERLVEVRLLEPGSQPGTYVMHNVLRSVAQDLAGGCAAEFVEEVRSRLIALFSGLAWRTRELARPTPVAFAVTELTAPAPPNWSRERCMGELAAHAEIWHAITRSAEGAKPTIRQAVARMTMGLITFFIAEADTAGWPDQLTAALVALADDTQPEAAWLHVDLALALSGNGDQSRATESAAHARGLAQRNGDIQCMCWARIAESLALSRDGNIEQARASLREVRDLAITIGDLRVEAAAWRDLTVLEHGAGQMAAAVEAGEKALRLYLQVGAERGVVMAQINLGVVLRDAEHHELAQPLLQQALTGAREIGDRALTTEALDELGHWHNLRGDCEGAVGLLHEGLDLVDEEGGRQWEARIRVRLACALQELGREDEASAHWAAAADVHLARGELEEAARAANQVAAGGARLRLIPGDVEPGQRSSG